MQDAGQGPQFNSNNLVNKFFLMLNDNVDFNPLDV